MKFTSVCALKFIWNVAERTAIQHKEFISSIAHFHHVFCVICFYGFSLINLYSVDFYCFSWPIFLVAVSLFVDIFVYAFSAYLRFITSVQLDSRKWLNLHCMQLQTNWNQLKGKEKTRHSKRANPLFRRLKYEFSRHFSINLHAQNYLEVWI